ncbi:MAG TPA: matrixin family metalloprotease [Clostridia bacterium]|nr:matrixin family metalloprotease [Clostridia bacterium]
MTEPGRDARPISTVRRISSVASIAAIVLLGLLITIPTFSYVSMYTHGTGGAQPDHWDFTAFPVTWSLRPGTGSNVTGNRPAADVIQASFATWQAAPNTSISVARGPDTMASGGFDGVNVVCFICTDSALNEAGTLAVTITTTADRAGQDTKHGQTSRFVGQILDADILFGPSVSYTTGGTSGHDLQTIATHEMGHFLGLDHSAVVRAVMFPFAPGTPLQTLGYDDVAGVSSIYPKSTPDTPTGGISGTVRFASSGPVFGAHVFADSDTTLTAFGSNIRKTPIGALTRPDGTYSIQGVPIDTYTVIAEPIDEPMTNSDLEGYASAFGKTSVQTDFNTRWH